MDDRTRANYINYGIGVIMVVLAAVIEHFRGGFWLWMVVAVAIVGTALVLRGHYPYAVTYKRIGIGLGVFALAALIGIGGWVIGRRSITVSRRTGAPTVNLTSQNDPPSQTTDPPCGLKPKPSSSGLSGNGAGISWSTKGPSDGIPTSDSASIMVTRGSSASGATIRNFITRGSKAIYEVDMSMPGWRPEELEFRFSGNRSFEVTRKADFPQSLRDSGFPLQVERFIDSGYEISDKGCPGIPYSVIWLRGSPLATSRPDPTQHGNSGSYGVSVTKHGNANSVGNMVVQPGGVASVGQQGGITAAKIEVNPLPAEHTWELSSTKCDEWVEKLDALGPVDLSIGAFISNNDGNRVVGILSACFQRSSWKPRVAVLPANPDGVEIGASQDGPKLDILASALSDFGIRVTRRDIRAAYGTQIGIIVGTSAIKPQQ